MQWVTSIEYSVRVNVLPIPLYYYMLCGHVFSQIIGILQIASAFCRNSHGQVI